MPVSTMGLMKELGYPTHPAGVCHGVAMMAERARRCGEYEKFVAREEYFKLFTTATSGYLEPLIKAAEKYEIEMTSKIAAAIAKEQQEAENDDTEEAIARGPKVKATMPDGSVMSVSPEEIQILLSVRPYFQQVWAHFNPAAIQRWMELPGPRLSQGNAYKVEELMYDPDSKDNKTSPLREPSIYPLFKSNDSGFEDVYLKLFLKSVQEEANAASVGLVICSPAHTVHLFYDKDKHNWCLTNHSELSTCQSIDEALLNLKVAFNNNIPNLSIQLYSDNTPTELTTLNKKLEDISHASLATVCSSNNVDILDNAGNTPLWTAAGTGCDDIVKAMLDAGANVNMNRYNRGTPLFIAAQNGHVGCVNALLQHKADQAISLKLTKAELLEFAAIHVVQKDVDAFLAENTPDNNQLYSVTPYHIAEMMGQTAVISAMDNFNKLNEQKQNATRPADDKAVSQPLVSKLDREVSNFGCQLFKNRVEPNDVFQSSTEKLLKKNGWFAGKNVAADVERIKQNLYENLLSKVKQSKFPEETIQQHQQLNALVQACLTVLKSYKTGLIANPEKIAMIVSLTSTLHELSQQTNANPKNQADDLMTHLQIIHDKIVDHEKSRFFGRFRPPGGVFLQSIENVLNDSQFKLLTLLTNQKKESISSISAEMHQEEVTVARKMSATATPSATPAPSAIADTKNDTSPQKLR